MCENSLTVERETFEYSLCDNYVEILFNCKNKEFKELSFEIEFNERPISWRNHDYTWVNLNKTRFSNDLSPKILKFKNENYLLSNKYIGVWEINPKNRNILKWHIHSSDLSPFFYFDAKGKRNWVDTPISFDESLVLKLFYGKTKPIEISRSKLPFSAVMIFTDHCDFDSDTLLVKQREFFKKHKIKVTKGFFLHHFSRKGDWNSSFERNSNEFYAWKEDGHELCYHALSQSTIWDDHIRINQFDNFESPVGLNVTTWIDHGYQPYNLSKADYLFNRLKTLNQFHLKGINLVWNYNDSGEAIINLNQNNFESFSLLKIWNSKISLTDKVRITLFYFGSESLKIKYRKLSAKIQKSKGNIPKITFYGITFILLLRCLWGLRINLKRSAQIFFHTPIKEVLGFQSIVVKDWVWSFSEPLDLLVHEKGVSIVHSYFAFLGEHHINPLFNNLEGEISIDIENSFKKVSRLIAEGVLWNPTLNEFMSYYKKINKSEIIIVNNSFVLNCKDILYKEII
jgi:hypothetical protein